LQEIYQSSNKEMFAISLSSCSRYNANFKLDQSQCSLFMTFRHIFDISEDDHPRLVTHARDIWWTLDFANAFVSPGVNSRGELEPSHGASRRRLGDYTCSRSIKGKWQYIFLFSHLKELLKQNIINLFHILLSSWNIFTWSNEMSIWSLWKTNEI
jgi:hypothetical protein